VAEFPHWIVVESRRRRGGQNMQHQVAKWRSAISVWHLDIDYHLRQ